MARYTISGLRSDTGRRASDELWKLRLVRLLYERGWEAEGIRQLFRFIDWMMDLPAEMEKQFWSEVQRYEQERHMPYITSVERRALERGRQEGEQKGRQEGQQEGEQRGLRRGIALGLKLRFGDAGLALLPEIEALHDPALLDRIVQAIETAASPEEIRQIWAATRPGPTS